jgi:rfaE bifunctional protein kinase chain/domain
MKSSRMARTIVSAGRARQLLHRARGRRVAVFGDAMLDEFIWGDATRISPEAPVPVILFERESATLGGAANVASNIRSLGGEAELFAALGDDAAAAKLEGLAGAAAIGMSGCVRVQGRRTSVKQRILAQSKHVLRVDREHTDSVSADVTAELLRRLRGQIAGVHAIAISDYAKGAITGALARGLLRTGREAGIPVCADPKLPEVKYPGATVLKPNLRELELLSGMRIRGVDGIAAAAQKVLRQYRPENLLITRGAEGMELFDRAGGRVFISAGRLQVSDVTGAGDTVLAALTLMLAAGATVEQAAAIANVAAGIVVSKPGTATVTPEEIMEALD